MVTLQYVTFIGDGGSKSYQNVCQEKPYGSEYPVKKSDCIGCAKTDVPFFVPSRSPWILLTDILV